MAASRRMGNFLPRNTSSGSPPKDRAQMVALLRERGIRDEGVLRVMGKLPRHLFVANRYWDAAYADHPLPIDDGQTISQPYIVALMTQALELSAADRVLEIGTGSGYQTALLAELAGHVQTIERSPNLLTRARARLTRAGYANIEYHCGDGTVGWPQHITFDKVIVTAATPEVPPALLRQLGSPGRLVVPLGGRQVQQLTLIRKEAAGDSREELCACSFLPLIGKEGWPESELRANGWRSSEGQ